MQFFIYFGLAFILISGIFIGGFTTGYQQRGNFYSEQKEDRKMKRKVANWSALAGIISFAIAGIIHLLN
ncbi:DUF5316 family protein [Paenibacillus donghaensis]|uniref:Uncharacterized protein n=1 Tax=Paenibacillus donghaensis TaxID=414771 RepID=A0A2Z2K9F4_9BACL|nr:DUF5316 family protein [Paenibacillus donghaensis]ASA23326.1 hypothetical protein B9T62_22475 [Paenibacillus donghaensis]